MSKQYKFKQKHSFDNKMFYPYNKNMNKLKEDINKLKEKNKNLSDLILYASQHFGKAWDLMIYNKSLINETSIEYVNTEENVEASIEYVNTEENVETSIIENINNENNFFDINSFYLCSDPYNE